MCNIIPSVLSFNTISITCDNVEYFRTNNLCIKNKNKFLKVKSTVFTGKNTILIFLDNNIDIKYYCYVKYKDLEFKANYSQLFLTSEFNDKYYYDGSLGLLYTKSYSKFKVWSPAATSVSLLLYKNGDIDIHEVPLEIKMKEQNGLWSVSVDEDLEGKFYTYKIHVYDCINEAVDPYAKAVGINGLRGAIIDFKKTNPHNWKKDTYKKCTHYTDAIIYEANIRDISIDSSSVTLNKGTFLGLTEDNTFFKENISTGLSHIKELGITHLQLMPFFDFSYISIDEKDPKKYNWGYDPQNYNVPEGSYSSNPYDPVCRILELKTMIQTLHKNNIAVNMDVVYNHMFHTTKNNFEKIFPGYYFRVDSSGKFSNGSGCDNDTESRNIMMRKFILDSLIYWTSEYHIDGFRFDLMGIHDIDTMNIIYNKLKKINKYVMLYGEGWDLNTPLSPFLKSCQKNSSMISHIGFFNDSIRDFLKGNIFSTTEKGFINGKDNLENQIKFCITGCSIPTNNFESIYTSPEQSINYVSCHDNHTLWDRLQISNADTSIEDRKNMVKLAGGIILTSQGVPFLHSGMEFCRTKQGISDSFKSPDNINSLNYNRKAEFLDIFNYYKGLIKLRHKHPAFKMHSVKHIKSNLEFIENTPKNTVAFILKNHSNNDIWKEILVIYNANNDSLNIDIPKNTWHQVVDKYCSGTEVLRIIEENNVEIKGISINVFFSS